MLRQCLDMLSTSAGQRVHALVRHVLVSVVLLFLLGLSVFFGALAGYVFLKDIHGQLIAALGLSILLALLALLCALWLRASTRREIPSAQVATVPEAPAASSAAEQQLMALAMQAGQNMTTGQMIALALVAGFVTGRKMD